MSQTVLAASPVRRHRFLTVPRLLVAAAAGLAGLASVGIMVGNEVRPTLAIEILLVPLVGLAFVGAGVVAHGLRPTNRSGTVMALTGAVWLVAGLYRSQDPVLFSIGHEFESLYLAGIVYLLLAFPSGRLGVGGLRAIAIAALLAAGPLEALFLALGGHALTSQCVGCPTFLFTLVNGGDLARLVLITQRVTGITVVVLSIVALGQRWRTASPALRFAIAPVIWTGAAVLPVLAVWVVSDETLGGNVGRGPAVAADAALVALAASFLVGVGRTRLARSAVADLLVEIGRDVSPGALEAALQRNLHDPTLRVAYWIPDGHRFVDLDGRSTDLPEDERAATIVERDGRRIAALIHDPELDEDLVRSASMAAALALDNERLQAALRSQLSEVRASRARIVEATQEERRRLERNIHDGAQQRLVAIGMTLGLAAAELGSDAGPIAALIAEARDGLAAAIAELRELSRGLHPALLTERGLGPAIVELVARTQLPVELDLESGGRLPPPVESAAYFVIAEALTNVAKHAAATRVWVSVHRRAGRAVVRISDDGAGGADETRGTGLRGLHDRTEALGGTLRLESVIGIGTTVEVELPCE